MLSFGQAGAPRFPEVLTSYPAGALSSVTTIDPDIERSAGVQAQLQIDREVTSGLVLSAGYEHLRTRGLIMSRNVNVPTLTAAQAALLGVPNLGRPGSHGREQQPLRQPRRRLVRRLHAGAHDAAERLVDVARVLHAVEGARHRRQRLLQQPAGQREHRRREGPVGQRSAAPARGQRHGVDAGRRHRLAARAARLPGERDRELRLGAAVHDHDRQRSQQRHQRQRSPGGRRPQHGACVVVGVGRSAGVAAVPHRPRPYRGAGRGLQPVQPDQPAAPQRRVGHRRDAAPGVRHRHRGRRSAAGAARSCA